MIKINFSKGLAPEQVQIIVNNKPFRADPDTMTKQYLFCGEIKKGFDSIKRQYRKELKKVKTVYAFLINYSDGSIRGLKNCFFDICNLKEASIYYGYIKDSFREAVTSYCVESGELGKATTKKEVKVYPVSIQLARFVDAGNAYYLACKTNPYYR